MEPHVYIFNSAGCHGHYLTYLIDRLSNRTPEINELPFNDLGNSHIKINYSGFAKFVDVYEHKNYSTLEDKNIIKIIYSDDILYYERAAMNRAGDANRNLNEIHKDISFLKNYNKEFFDKLNNLYSIENNSVPKWLLRDAYKIGFLDRENQGSVVTSKQDIAWMQNILAGKNTIHYTQVDMFFTTKKIKEELQVLDKKFNLNLELNELETIHSEFLKRNKLLQTHKNTDMVLDSVKQNKNIPIAQLDIIQQAYIYAELEKQYDFVTMPITDHFFENTQQIIDYVKMYPEHYKSMNPNLPKFKGIDNPFFLYRQKTK